MDIEKLQDYYNRIDKCAVIIDREVDFDYIQKAITRIAIFTEDLNRIIGEILVEKTKLEHSLTDKTFDYELHFTKFSKETPFLHKPSKSIASPLPVLSSCSGEINHQPL